jgi:hypothetical protein
MLFDDHREALKCSEIEAALRASFKDTFERKVVVCLDPIKKGAIISGSWDVEYTSPRMRVLFYGWKGKGYCSGCLEEHIPLVTPNDICSLDYIHSQYYRDVIEEENARFYTYDQIMDAVSSRLACCITSGLIVDNVNDTELQTLKVERLEITHSISNEKIQVNQAEEKDLCIIKDNGIECLHLNIFFPAYHNHEELSETLAKSLLKLKNAMKSSNQDISTLY